MHGEEIIVYGVPIPQGSSKAFYRPGMKHPVITHDNLKTKPWRQAVVDSAREIVERGETIEEGPVAVSLVFYLPRPKSAPKRVAYPAKKPDLDKLVRAILDALTVAGIWRDDAQVVSITAHKQFSGGPGDPLLETGVPRAAISVRRM